MSDEQMITEAEARRREWAAWAKSAEWAEWVAESLAAEYARIADDLIAELEAAPVVPS